MTLLTAYTKYADTIQNYSSEKLWDLLDGDKSLLNIAHECIDRHAGSERVAIRIAHADGRRTEITFDWLSKKSAQFAHRLRSQGVAKGHRVAIMLEPSPEFYVSLFGCLKAGAAVVPLFTLFGPDAIAARLTDSGAKLLVKNAAKSAEEGSTSDLPVWVTDDEFLSSLDRYPTTFLWDTTPADVAIYQYTSGTTRDFPVAVKMTHRSIAVTLLPGLYGVGLRPGDRFFCPSSPAWGHGLWQGTLAPLALGISTGTYSGKFDASRLLDALQDFAITNISAAATHFRMIRIANVIDNYKLSIQKLSFAGEPMDAETEEFLKRHLNVRVASIYGSTEVGAILVHYPEAEDVVDKPGSLGLPVPGSRIEVQDDTGNRSAVGDIGEIKVWRHNRWLGTRDLGWQDRDGYFFHAGRADDVIISAGWTLNAAEIENAMLRHTDVAEAAAIGVPDETRGQVVKAFIVSSRSADENFADEIRKMTRDRLGQHEFPRLVEFVAELPKTPAGKVNRKALRDRERTAILARR